MRPKRSNLELSRIPFCTCVYTTDPESRFTKLLHNSERERSKYETNIASDGIFRQGFSCVPGNARHNSRRKVLVRQDYFAYQKEFPAQNCTFAHKSCPKTSPDVLRPPRARCLRQSSPLLLLPAASALWRLLLCCQSVSWTSVE